MFSGGNRTWHPDAKPPIIEVGPGELASGDAAFAGPAWPEDELRLPEAHVAAGQAKAPSREDAGMDVRQPFE